jgi:SAM-dependent methyltransferase
MTSQRDLYERYRSTHVVGLEGGAAVDRRQAMEYLRKNFLPHLPEEKDAHILDLGCGDGRYVAALQATGYRNAIGVDWSTEQTEYARDVVGAERIIQADVFEFLRNRETLFQAILLIDVLEHLEASSSIDLLCAIRSRLLPRGVLLVQVPNAVAPLSPWRYADLTHQRAYTTFSLLQSLSLAGFERGHTRFFESTVPARGVKATVRASIWRLLLRPGLILYSYVAVGNTLGGIFSANIIATVKV